MTNPRRVGVLGGTFDPVHNGHLHIANALRAALQLDQVVWVPAGRPPHKSGQIVSADRDRLAMLELALAGSGDDAVSTIDMERAGPSYTADMLELLHERLAPVQLVFLMGEDSLRDLPNWHEPQRILRAAEIAVAERPGVVTDLAALAERIPEIAGRVSLVPTPEVAISSSEIRQRVASGLPIDHLVPPAVAAYIAEHQLYRNDAAQAASLK